MLAANFPMYFFRATFLYHVSRSRRYVRRRVFFCAWRQM